MAGKETRREDCKEQQRKVSVEKVKVPTTKQKKDFRYMFIVLKMVSVCQQDEGENGPVKEISLDFLMEQASQVDSSGTQAPAERWQASGKLVLCCKFTDSNCDSNICL